MSMRRYESFSIIDPEIAPEERTPLLDRFKEIIDQHGGTLVELDEWGTRKLAYEIKNKARGYYVRLDYCADGDAVQELERFCRIDDRVLKYMSVLLEKDVDMEQIEQEMAQAAEARKAKAEKESEAAGESGQSERETESEARQPQPAVEATREEKSTAETEPEPETETDETAKKEEE